MLNKDTMQTKIELHGVNKLRVTCNVEGATQYAFYIYKDGEIVKRYPYSSENSREYRIQDSGTYYGQAYAKNESDEKIAKNTEKVTFQMEANIQLSDVNKLSITSQVDGASEYAYYIYKDEEIIARFPYIEKNSLAYWLSESGTYYAKVYIKNEEGDKFAMKTDEVYFDEEKAFGVEEEVTPPNFLERVADTTNEIFSNMSKIKRVSKFDFKLENQGTYLGGVWSVLTPLIQIGTYWFVFGIGLRSGKDVDGYPYLAWMLTGIIPWFFINACLLKGANSIYSKIATITKMKYPIATVPVSRILQELYEFMVTIVIMMVLLFANGIYPTLSWLNLIYYFVYCFAFCVTLSLVTSVFTMLVRDFYKLLNSLIRLLFYLTPILWSMDNMPELYQKIMRLNPIYYIIKGFRESILYQIPFYADMKYALIMWGIVIFLYMWGCSLQSKFKNKFVDLI